jgi:hypothetical protein
MLEFSKTGNQFWTNFFAGHYVYQSVTRVIVGTLLLEFGGFKVIVHIDILCVPIINKLIVAILKFSNFLIKTLEYRFDHQQPPAAMYRLSQLSKVVLYSILLLNLKYTEVSSREKKVGKGFRAGGGEMAKIFNLFQLISLEMN